MQLMLEWVLRLQLDKEPIVGTDQCSVQPTNSVSITNDKEVIANPNGGIRVEKVVAPVPVLVPVRV
jgi:hypothetical protein